MKRADLIRHLQAHGLASPSYKGVDPERAFLIVGNLKLKECERVRPRFLGGIRDFPPNLGLPRSRAIAYSGDGLALTDAEC